MVLESPARKRFKRVLWAAATLLAFVLCWYAWGRLTSPSRAVRMLSGSTGSVAAPAGEFSICIYNIAHGRGQAETNWAGDRERRLAAIGQLIAERKPDVVVLNEVDFDASWSGRVNQAERISREVGTLNRAEGRNIDVSLPFFRLAFGNAVLSRYPIVEARKATFPGFSTLETLAGGKKNEDVATFLILRADI